MTASHQAWLPPTALIDGVLSDAAGSQVRSWESRWFTAGKGASTRLQMGASSGGERAVSWATPCNGLVLSCADSVPIRLGCTLIGIGKPPPALSAADARLLKGIGDACLRDLLASLAAVFGLAKVPPAAASRGSRADAVLRFAITLPGLSIKLDAHLSQDAAVSARKALAPSPREPSPLGARRAAIEAQAFSVGAAVGWGKVDLAELSALAVGDVLLLEGALGPDLVLHVNGRPTSDPQIELAQTGSALVLRERKSETRAA